MDIKTIRELMKKGTKMKPGTALLQAFAFACTNRKLNYIKTALA